MTRTQVFVSYSHKDEGWKHRIYTHLDVLQKNNRLKLWCDREIRAGQKWRDNIDYELSSAKVAVLIISPAFLTSEFITKHEIPQLLKKHQQDGMELVPVLLRDCVWEEVEWLRNMQMVPRDGKPVVGFSEAEIDTVLAGVAREVLKCVITKGAAGSRFGDTSFDQNHPQVASPLSNVTVSGQSSRNSDQYRIGPLRLWHFVFLTAIATMGVFLFILLAFSEWRNRILEGHRIVEPGIVGFALIYTSLIWADISFAKRANPSCSEWYNVLAVWATAIIVALYLIGFSSIYLTHP